MAEENTTVLPRKIKAGNQEYSSDDLIKLAREHKNAFINFAKEKGKFNNEQLSQLSTIIDKMGDAISNSDNISMNSMMSELYDTSNTFVDARDENGQVVEGRENLLVSVQTRKGNIFRKSQYTQEDLNQWGAYFFSTLLKTMSPYQDKPKEQWNINKHGFGAWLKGQGNTPQQIYDTYDIIGEKAKSKSTEERRALLLKDLTAYRNHIQGRGFDFTQNDNEYDDNYIEQLENIINNYANISDGELKAKLNYLGANDFVKGYLSTDLKWDTPNEQILQQQAYAEAAAAEEERRKQEEERRKQEEEQNAQWAQYESEVFNDLLNSTANDQPLTFTLLDTGEQDFNYAYSHVTDNKLKSSPYYQLLPNLFPEESRKLLKQILDSYNMLITEKPNIDPLAGVILQKAFNDDGGRFTDIGNGWYIIPDTLNKSKGTVLLYNPRSGLVKREFIGRINGFMEMDIRRELDRIINNIIKSNPNKYPGYNRELNYTVPYSILSNKEGGILKMQYGSSIVFDTTDWDQGVKDRAKQHGRTKELQKAKERPIFERNSSLAHPDAGFGGTEWARIGFAAADLASAIAAFAPGAGTVMSGGLGLASTLGNFATDLFFDDAVTTGEAFKNLGFGLAMDAAGLIPGVGTTTKLGKAIKVVAKYAPHVIAALMTVGAAPEIISSFLKIKGNEPLTSEDYRNMMQGLLIVLQMSGTAGRAYQMRKKRNASIQDDKVGLEIINDKGKREKIVFEGETADKVKKNVNIINEHADDTKVNAARKRLDVILKQHNITGARIADHNNNSTWQNIRHPFTNWLDGGGKRRIELQDVVDNSVYSKPERLLMDIGIRQRTAKLDPSLQAKINTAAQVRANRANLLRTGEAKAKARKTQYDSEAARRQRTELIINTEQLRLDDANNNIATTTTEQNSVMQRIADIKNARAIQPGQTVSAVRAARNKIKQIKKDPEYKRILDKISRNQTLSRIERRRLQTFEQQIKAADDVIHPNTLEELNNATTRLADLNKQIALQNKYINVYPSRIQANRDWLTQSTAHSPEFDAAINAGIPERKLLDIGWWKEGGKINKSAIAKDLNKFKI